MKKFKGMLLACDMDGTLLDDDKQIPAENEKALQYFTEQGGRFSIATGRSPYAIGNYMELLPINAPYSVMNGALIGNGQGRTLYCAGMPKQTKEMIHQVLLNNSQLGCEIFTAENVLVRKMSDYTLQHMHKLHLNFDMLADEQFAVSDVNQWCTVNFTGEPELIQCLARWLSIQYSDVFDITASIPTFCEITAAGVNKGSALKYIASHTIDVKHVFAVGDSFNDMSMLHAAKISFAPENATEEVLKSVDVVVSSNNQHAVADVIEYLEGIL